MYFINLKSYKIDLWLLLLGYYNSRTQLLTALFTSFILFHVGLISIPLSRRFYLFYHISQIFPLDLKHLTVENCGGCILSGAGLQNI